MAVRGRGRGRVGGRVLDPTGGVVAERAAVARAAGRVAEGRAVARREVGTAAVGSEEARTGRGDGGGGDGKEVMAHLEGETLADDDDPGLVVLLIHRLLDQLRGVLRRARGVRSAPCSEG